MQKFFGASIRHSISDAPQASSLEGHQAQLSEPRHQTHPHVLVVGEALIDIIAVPGSAKESPGGSPANVALGLARLGIRTSFLTALGPDSKGQAIASRLRAAGVEILPESWSLPATSTARAEIQTDGSALYTFDINWTLPAQVPLPQVDHVHIGSISAFISPGADEVEKIVTAIRPHATVSFDPNIRRDLVGDKAEALKRFERIAGLADVLKLSDEDAAFLYPGLTEEEAARTIASKGPVTAVTKGARGSLLLSAGEIITIDPIPDVRVQDTVGAGDSYMAALLTALLRRGRPQLEPLAGSELLSAGTFAADAAAITVSRTGAEPPTLLDLPAFVTHPSSTSDTDQFAI